jgi:hypothetical protein
MGVAMREGEFEYDVALSFAGEDRAVADRLASMLHDSGVTVFYDLYEPDKLWGKDLYQYFQTVYRDSARYCIVFISEHYAKKLWTRHELKQAQARAFRESAEYILPIRIDDAEIPGLNETIGYVELKRYSLSAMKGLILRKLYGDKAENIDPEERGWKGDTVSFRGMEVASFWPDKLAKAQYKRTYKIVQRVMRIPYGEEKRFGDYRPDKPCHDCAALPGEFHVPGCDWEECPGCGGQASGCDCILDQD